jgi:acyl-CoA synthetase (NDP forming)
LNHSFSSLRTLLEPRSVAIVGASDNIARIGGRPLRYLLQYAKDVAVYPVKPGSNEIQGVRSFPSLRDLPEKVDLCIFATPAEISVEEFNAYAGESFRSALIFSGGFSESVAEGMALQERLKTIADARNVPVLGPNCLGFASIKSRVFGTLASAFEELKIEAGSTAILSQGGGFAINLLVEAATRKVKLSRMLSTGNEVNVDIADLMNFLAEDPLTSQVIAIIEGVRDGNRLGAAMARLREAGKTSLRPQNRALQGGSPKRSFAYCNRSRGTTPHSEHFWSVMAFPDSELSTRLLMSCRSASAPMSRGPSLSRRCRAGLRGTWLICAMTLAFR